jgi:hypothetical protein
MVRIALRGAAAGLLFALVQGIGRPVLARPQYLAKFQADPYRRVEVDGCGTCHVNPDGGGARNDFGAAFQASGTDITPLLRAAFPQQFTFDSVKLPDGVVLHFSDPQGKVVVVEREKQRSAVSLAEITAPKVATLPPAANRMSFFVTSKGFASARSIGGLAGADQQCQALAKAAGAGDRTWRAYLSTSFKGTPAVNAGDRIGAGPWFNAKGVEVARGAVDLHVNRRIDAAVVLSETGEPFDKLRGTSPSLAIVTGSNPDGTAAADKNCGNWAMPAGEAVAGDPVASWNSERMIACGADGPGTAAADLRLYCFAVK